MCDGVPISGNNLDPNISYAIVFTVSCYLYIRRTLAIGIRGYFIELLDPEIVIGSLL